MIEDICDVVYAADLCEIHRNDIRKLLFEYALDSLDGLRRSRIHLGDTFNDLRTLFLRQLAQHLCRLIGIDI